MGALVGAADGAGKQGLLVVGGEGAAPGLRIASSPEHLASTLKSVLSLVDRYGYDGIDVDWEPLAPQDADLYSSFIESLRKSLDQTALHHRRPRLGFTTAIAGNLNNTDYLIWLVRT